MKKIGFIIFIVAIIIGVTFANLFSWGKASANFFNFSVSSTGDVNGDGFDDVIISGSDTPVYSFPNGLNYVVFGKASGFPATLLHPGGNRYRCPDLIR